MIFFKKLVVLKIVVTAIICIILINETNVKRGEIPYLFNLFILFISSVYVFVCFKFVDNANYSVKYYLITNILLIATLFPLVVVIFSDLLPLYSCLFFILSMADSLFFGLTLYKFAFDKVTNSMLLKLMLGNLQDKKN
ncbi:hypothetical protein DNU54_23195 [Salmonella enterica subsp. enterica serovar Ajiobo]|uniref:hypothetical protein n=1 Tax=Morganella morganii TaxID=582 RepID=UPI0012F21E6E|nr:hypothetical protein [Morganella morganii]EBR0129984.1 hypothetical protein [Salmonella enterica subsp. enterica serovar Ajiobo]EBW4865268.1 hypothetical protein [Salmonella enterica subsp. enterica serovar Oranienburg]MBT0473626.1 hypothetical protein [Morganella morganii subsp. morganii]UMW89888.1 hypothetical protein [Morganella morganii]